MIDHTGIGVANVARSAAFYDAGARSMPSAARSFVSQRLDRIQGRCLASGIKAKKYPDRAAHAEREDDRPERNDRLEIRKDLDEPRDGDATSYSDEPSQHAENHGFDEKLQLDGGGLRSHGDSNTYLPRAFGNADEHDVHDADATNQERDAGDGSEEQRDDPGDLAHGIGNFLLIENVEIVLAIRRQTMTLAKKARDLLLRGVHTLRADDL